MYYHCRPLKYVQYGKIVPPPPSEYDEWDDRLYGWLGHHCGYSPQIWLSKSDICMTGYRNLSRLKVGRFSAKGPKRRQYVKIGNNSILFGFDIIKGFPVKYDNWSLMMSSICDESSLKSQNKAIINTMNNILDDYIADEEEPEGPIADWNKANRDFDSYLRDFVFKEVDQVVVPSLNLKSAKKVLCHNEKQKKKLRKMGFIEDRIQERNLGRFMTAL